jgi:hypothetical protein
MHFAFDVAYTVMRLFAFPAAPGLQISNCGIGDDFTKLLQKRLIKFYARP